MSPRLLVSIVRVLTVPLLCLASMALAASAHAEHTNNDEPLTPEQIYASINSGWYDSLASIGKKLRPDRNYIIINLVEPDHAMDLRSAEQFRRSFIAPGGERGFSKPEIGHTILAWQCRDHTGHMYRGTTGLSGENNQQSMKMLRAGWGLSTLASTFTDGELQGAEDAADEFAEARKSRKHIWGAIFEVDDTQCGDLYRFLTDFIFHPNHPLQNFGLMLDPEKFEGGGCGSFGSALVRHTRILPTNAIDKLRRTVSAPSSLFGWGLPYPEDTKPFTPAIALEGRQTKRISLLKLLDESWDRPGPRESLSLIDPELFIFTLRTLHHLHFETLKEAETLGHAPNGTLKTTQDAYFTRYPKERIVTSIHSLAKEHPSTPILPDEPLWATERYPINTDFDDHTNAIETSLRAWWKAERQAGHSSDMIFDGRLAYVVIHRPHQSEQAEALVKLTARYATQALVSKHE